MVLRRVSRRMLLLFMGLRSAVAPAEKRVVGKKDLRERKRKRERESRKKKGKTGSLKGQAGGG